MGGLLSRWLSEWRQRRQAAGYAAVLRQEPADGDVEWVAADATQGDTDRARWELRYARMALGLLAAERDALDDLTPSIVAREVAAALHTDPRIAAQMVKVADQQFNERLSAYRHALNDRAAQSAVNDRIGDMFLRLAGAAPPNAETRARASALAGRWLEESNAALRQHFGAAVLPPDVQPSLLATKR